MRQQLGIMSAGIQGNIIQLLLQKNEYFIASVSV